MTTSATSTTGQARDTAPQAQSPEPWWPVMLAVTVIAMSMLFLGVLAVVVLTMIRSGALDFSATGGPTVPEDAEVGAAIRADLYNFALASSESFTIVVPALAAVLATLLVWLAIPAAGTWAEADRIRRVREVVSQTSHVATGALIAWLIWGSTLAILVPTPGAVDDRINQTGLLTAWILLPLVFVLGICCGRFTGGDASYRLDTARITSQRRTRHLEWLDPTRAPDGKTPRSSWRWLRPRHGRPIWVDWMFVAIPQVLFAFLSLPILFLVLGAPIWEVIPFTISEANLATTAVVFIAAVLAYLVWATVLGSGGATAGIFAVLYVLGVAALSAGFFLAAARAEAERQAPLQWIGWFIIGVAVVQTILLLLPYGRRGNPAANIALRSALRSAESAEAALQQARRAVDLETSASTTLERLDPLSQKEARAYLKLSRPTFREIERSGDLPRRTIGRDIVYIKSELDLFLSSKAASSQDPGSGTTSPEGAARATKRFPLSRN
jgi:hypothetical protein